jgi:uncharacterized membrane protein
LFSTRTNKHIKITPTLKHTQLYAQKGQKEKEKENAHQQHVGLRFPPPHSSSFTVSLCQKIEAGMAETAYARDGNKNQKQPAHAEEAA